MTENELDLWLSGTFGKHHYFYDPLSPEKSGRKWKSSNLRLGYLKARKRIKFSKCNEITFCLLPAGILAPKVQGVQKYEISTLYVSNTYIKTRAGSCVSSAFSNARQF